MAAGEEDGDSHLHLGAGAAPLKPTVTGDSRHGLVDGLHPIAHGKLIHDLLRCLIKVNLPGIVPLGIGDLHHPVVLQIRHEVEEVLEVQMSPVSPAR